MIKRIVLISVFALVLVSAPAFSQSWGAGLAFGIDPIGGLPGASAMLTVKPPQLPVTIGVGLVVGAERFQMGTTLDWIAIRENLFRFVNVYVGPGVYFALPDQLEVGARVPIGLNAFPADWFELFFEVAPRLALFSDGTIEVPDFGFQSAAGFRFWF